MKPARAAAVFAMLALAISCRASGAPNQGKTAMDTLSGKLAVAPARIASTGSATLTLELTNRAAATLRIPSGSPLSFHPVVRDTRGAVVEPSAQRLDVLSSPHWIDLEPGKSTTLTLSIKPEAGHQLDVTTHTWRLTPGTYQIGGRFVVEAGDAPKGAWIGALDLAPVALEVTP
jgi:hypothetical protein